MISMPPTILAVVVSIFKIVNHIGVVQHGPISSRR